MAVDTAYTLKLLAADRQRTCPLAQHDLYD